MIFSAFLNRWLGKRNLSARDRGAVERVGAVGMALDHHCGGQHHRERHGCEDKAHEFQPAAVSHRHSPVFTALPSKLSSIRFTMRYRKIRSMDVVLDVSSTRRNERRSNPEINLETDVMVTALLRGS